MGKSSGAASSWLANSSLSAQFQQVDKFEGRSVLCPHCLQSCSDHLGPLLLSLARITGIATMWKYACCVHPASHKRVVIMLGILVACIFAERTACPKRQRGSLKRVVFALLFAGV